MTSLSDIIVYAYPGGNLVNISADVLGARLGWGIRGVEQTDILADTGDARLTLKNIDKIYYPDGASALSGWSNNIPVQIILVDENGVRHIRFKGYLDIDNIRVGKRSTQNRVSITLLDWLRYATDAPIKSPNIGENQKINQAITTLLTYIQFQPASTSLETGDYTFPTVFDNIGTKTKIYTELSKLSYSESPGHIYLTKDRTNGETLTSENATHRDSSHAQSSTTALTADYLVTVGAEPIVDLDGNQIQALSVTEGSTTLITINSDIDDVEIDYGKNIKNYATVTAWPRRVDEEPQVLYALDYPMAIGAGESVQFRAPYVDQQSGRPIGAIVSSMLDPVAPGEADTYRKLLLHFEGDFTDSTGNHTVTNNDAGTLNDVYVDPGPEPDVTRITDSILGSFTVLGGYADFNLSAPSSSDFEFGTGAFSMGCYAAVLDPASGDGIMARDGTTTYPPFVFGESDGTDLLFRASSAGASFDIASGKSMGTIQRNRWVHYEVGRDEDGFFHIFADGKRTEDPFYSASSLVSNSNALSVGKIQGANYMFVGLDELFIDKGRCLHTKEFEPPKKNMSETYAGDYWLNTAIDESGTDNSSDLVVGANYTSNSVYYTVKNTNASAGFFYVQARGRGVYPYNPIDDIKQDETSQQDKGIKDINVQQRYQQNLAAGSSWVTEIISDDKSARTRLKSVSFYANRNSTTMARFLQGDIGDLIRVTLSDPGIDGYYYIQNVDVDIQDKFEIYVTWGLKEGETPA